jgi:hypothetical protein
MKTKLWLITLVVVFFLGMITCQKYNDSRIVIPPNDSTHINIDIPEDSLIPFIDTLIYNDTVEYVVVKTKWKTKDSTIIKYDTIDYADTAAIINDWKRERTYKASIDTFDIRVKVESKVSHNQLKSQNFDILQIYKPKESTPTRNLYFLLGGAVEFKPKTPLYPDLYFGIKAGGGVEYKKMIYLYNHDFLNKTHEVGTYRKF